MIPIYIPSRDRTWTFRSEFNPIKQMSFAQRKLVTYVVPDGDEDLYRSDMPGGVGDVLPMRYQDIAEKRLKIGLHALSEGHRFFMMFDDDIKWFRRKDFESTKLIPAKPEDIDIMLDRIGHYLAAGFSHVGVSAREGNNRFGPADDWSGAENTRVMRAVGYNTADFLSVEHRRVPVMEDFDVSLQLLRRGRANLNLTYFAQDQKGTQTHGGCTDFRTKEVHEAAAVKLAELHPEFVRLRDKVNKSGGDFGTRKEVTISWKKAYASHQK